MLLWGNAPKEIGAVQRVVNAPATFRPSCRAELVRSAEGSTIGEGAMIRVMIDAVLFSCMGALLTGIVMAAATFIS
jgi:hypothetical protein